jgi:sulfate adenylyltransferase subunit 2
VSTSAPSAVELDRIRHLVLHRRGEDQLPSIYYAHKRQVFERDGMLLAVHKYLQPRKEEPVLEKTVRFRTVGDVTCTGCVESLAGTVSR